MSAQSKEVAQEAQRTVPISVIYTASILNTSLLPLPLTSLLLHPFLCAIPAPSNYRIEPKIPVTRIETVSAASKWRLDLRNSSFQLPFQTRKAAGKIGVLELEDLDQDDTTT